MNSSPPAPSITLPPLPSSGHYATPSPTPSDSEAEPVAGLGLAKGKGKATADHDDDENHGRISMYVKLFDEMTQTVLASESYLFNAHELHVLQHILGLPYKPHYLLTRLLLRRPNRTHPLSSLQAAYSGELGEDGVLRALETLAKPLHLPPDFARVPPAPQSLHKANSTKRVKPWDGIETGLSVEDERRDPDLAEAIRESIWAEKVGRVIFNDEEDDAVATPRPQLSRQSSSRPPSLRRASTSSTSTLIGGDLPQTFSLAPQEESPILALAADERSMTLDHLMVCLSADELRRVARSRQIPLSSLGTRDSTMAALRDLARRQTTLSFMCEPQGKAKATQAQLPFGRPHTEHLIINQLLPLVGGHAIRLDPALHKLVARVNLIFTRTPPQSDASLFLPSILVQSHKRRYPDYGPPVRSVIWQSRQELLVWERAVVWEATVADALGDTWVDQRTNPQPGFAGREYLSRTVGARVVRKIWADVWPVWQEMVAKDVNEGVGDRFRTEHVLTRIIYKGASALGILHEYDNECMVLRALLAQRRWRRSKRGAWYDRLALVLMNHYNTSSKKQAKLEDATQVCIDGLLDEDTHMIYRPALSRRLRRLEMKLNLPANERHISYAELLKCEIRELVAPRVAQNLGMPRLARNGSGARASLASLGRGRSASVRADEPEDAVVDEGKVQQVGKSVWLGREGEVTVEGWVLEWWEAKGYRGYHSESSILTTLFALLMWPVLFHPIAGAFETRYQTAPLDLGEDTFAPARRDLIETRLERMSTTAQALEMLRETDQQERANCTWAVGLNWDYTRDDLEELLRCMGGRAMSGICRMLCEEYRHRVSGVPDLVVWNAETNEARFIEVKGPGDSLSETQKRKRVSKAEDKENEWGLEGDLSNDE
ncbi:hypothetical protein Q5752_007015 [Cryptotrichosporon argae]